MHKKHTGNFLLGAVFFCFGVNTEKKMKQMKLLTANTVILNFEIFGSARTWIAKQFTGHDHRAIRLVCASVLSYKIKKTS